MDKIYSPEAIEQSAYRTWESRHYFEPNMTVGEPYCIMLPPPNVTGSLHMGHGFQLSIIDAIIRYKRMMGLKTLWQPGTDHAGISTQLIVEGQLESKGIQRKDLKREDFLEHVWEWKKESGGNITRQIKRMGASIDWSRERFTMDEGLSQAVLKVFVQLYEEGLIYRGSRLVNWDPQLGTAISDLEVISEEENGNLWHIKYQLENSDDYLVVATTRPETLLGDAAVAIHPEDARYKHFIGKNVNLPLCNRLIPIITDTAVDMEFGTGCLKITPAHDFNDYAIGSKHQLPLIEIFTKKATINKNAPVKYQNLDRFVAREKILEDLKKQDLLIKTEPHRLKVPRGEKSNAIIEPLLTEQWYIKMKPLAAPAIEAVKNGEIKFFPNHWQKTYFQWMENIEDWCISRQLWWGHRIPAWYDEEEQVYVGYSEDDVRFKYQLGPEIKLIQDSDVLDTWFSSALWPFASLGWPKQTLELEQFFPTDALVTGFDIIFFWVARMIMMSLKFTHKIPFKDVIITGLICDAEGKKMSKSKGNVLDPIDIIDGISLEALVEKRTSNLMLKSVREEVAKSTRKQFGKGLDAFGADALRFTFCSLASPARIVRFDIERVAGYRNFCNKLWNASRFVLMNIDEENSDFGDNAFQYSFADKWILSRLQRVKALVHNYFANYRLDLVANALYDFVWHEYCDWYLEFSKTVMYDDEAVAPLKRGARRTLIHVLSQILKLLHPIIPYITEAIWAQVGKWTSENGETIVISHYPFVENDLIDENIELEINWLKEIIETIRTMRSEMGINPAARTPLHIKHASTKIQKHIQNYSILINALGKLSEITFLKQDAMDFVSAVGVVGELELRIPIVGLVDKDSALKRLTKEIAKLEEDIIFAEKKLKNPQFTSNAPKEIIQKEEDKLYYAKSAREKLLSNRKTIEAL